MTKSRVWINPLLVVQLLLIIGSNVERSLAVEEPLGRNYRKNFNNYPVNSHAVNNGKILSTSETKISSVSFKPDGGKFSSLDNTNLKTSASEKEEEKFSIGLGVLSPSYSQKFGEDGKTKLDFNSDKGGFSYSLTNVVHPQSNSPSQSSSAAAATSSAASAPIATNTLNKVQSEGFVPSSYYNPTPQPNPQVNIYHKQTADPTSQQAIYGRLSSNANNYPVPPPPPTAQSSYAPQQPSPLAVPQNQPAIGGGGGNPLGPFGGYNPYASANPYAAAIGGGGGPQPFSTALSDAEKSFLQTAPLAAVGGGGGYNPYTGAPIGAHQHTLPQPLPAAASSPAIHHHQQQQLSAQQQAITQPKLVAQQQLTANPNSANIIHNANYGPYSNPYGGPSPAAGPNPYESLANPLANPYGAAAGLNMAASQQYPTNQFGSPMDALGGGAGGAMNYDFLNEFLY